MSEINVTSAAGGLYVSHLDNPYRQELLDALTGRTVDVVDHVGVTRRGTLLGGRERGITIQLERPVAGRDRWLYAWSEIRSITEVPA